MFRSKKEVLATIKTHKTIKGSVEYNVYVAFLGSDPVTQKKIRVARADLGQLKDYITDFYRRLNLGGEVFVALSPYQAADARNAYDLLAQNGITMTLVDCVRAAINHRTTSTIDGNKCYDISIGSAVSKYLESIESRSCQYKNGMKCHLGFFAAKFGSSSKLSEVTAPALKKYLLEKYYDAQNTGTWVTYNDVLGNLKTFFRWCTSMEQQFLSINPIECMKRLEIGYRQPQYVKAADTEKLFRVLEKHKIDEPEVLADAILSFMCGMRQAEIARVREGEEAVRICLDEGFIRVIKCKGSTRGIRPRAFHIPPQALTWMKSFDFMSAVHKKNRLNRKVLTERAKEAGISLPKNAGRHTFITMFEAVHHDSNALSAIVGNTESVRSKSYNGVELEREGRAYFSILPSSAQPEMQKEPALVEPEEALQAQDSLNGLVSSAS